MRTFNWAVLLISIAIALVAISPSVVAVTGESLLIQSTATIPNTALIQKAGIGIQNEGDVVIGSTPVPTSVTTQNGTANVTANVTTLKPTTTTPSPTSTPTAIATTLKSNASGVITPQTIKVTPTVWRTITPRSKSNVFVTGTIPVPKFTGKYPTPFTTLIVGITTSVANQTPYVHKPFQSWMWQ